MKAGHLRVIDAQGELQEYPDECPACIQYERQLRTVNARLTKLQQDKEAQAREHKLWDEASTVHDWWRIACDHPGVSFGAEDFYQALPRLNEMSPVELLKAIAGAAFDPSTRKMRNGRLERYDSWELIMRSKAKAESFIQRAPGKPEGEEWKLWLVQRIESRLKA